MNDINLSLLMKAVENQPAMSPQKKNILCLLLAAIECDFDGLSLAEINENINLNRQQIYRLLVELEEENLITRVKRGRYMHVIPILETIENLAKKQELKKNFMSKAKLRIASKK